MPPGRDHVPRWPIDLLQDRFGAQVNASPPASRVGADLRAARERLGWSIEDTAAFVRIRLPFLRAIEEGRFGDLPGPVYATGFVRSYALSLGADAEEMTRRYREEVGAAPQPKLDFPTPVPRRGVPAGAMVMLGVLVVVGAYAAWYRTSADRPVAVAVEQVPARLAPLALPVVAAPSAKMAGGAARDDIHVAGAYVPSPVAPSAAEAAVPAPGTLSPVEPSPLAGAGGATTHLTLAATADAWVQVRDGEGKIVLSKLMHAGDRWAVPDAAQGAAPMSLTTGNAGGTSFTLDGRELPKLGADGAVKRDVKLTQEGIAAAAAAGAAGVN